MRFLALLISSFFHPAFVPLLGFLLIYMLSGYAFYLPEQTFWFSVVVIIQFTILIPIAGVYFLYWRKRISSIELNVLKERPLPLVINLVSYSVAYLIFRYLPFPKIIVNYFAVIVVTAGVSMVVSLNYKISLHAVGWGSLVGVLYALSLKIGIELHLMLSILIVSSAIIITARLWLKAHSWHEVYSAWLSSALIGFLGMTYL